MSRIDLKKLSAEEFIDLVADAMRSTRVPKTTICLEESCNNPIRKGIRCDDCKRLRKKRADAAFDARRKKKQQPSHNATPTPEKPPAA